MGRGRSKAKQTKVARRLKYQTFDTDFASLQRELSSAEQAELEAREADGDDDAEAYDEDDDYR